MLILSLFLFYYHQKIEALETAIEDTKMVSLKDV